MVQSDPGNRPSVLFKTSREQYPTPKPSSQFMPNLWLCFLSTGSAHLRSDKPSGTPMLPENAQHITLYLLVALASPHL